MSGCIYYLLVKKVYDPTFCLNFLTLNRSVIFPVSINLICCLNYVPVNSCDYVGSSPPFYGTSTQHWEHVMTCKMYLKKKTKKKNKKKKTKKHLNITKVNIICLTTFAGQGQSFKNVKVFWWSGRLQEAQAAQVQPPQ